MNSDDFSKLYTEFETQERSLLLVKRGEYADNNDVLINFKQNAEFLGITPEELCFCYMMKHIQSVGKGIKKPETRLGFTAETGEGFSQRISDARNYLVLLAAIVGERK